MTLEYLLKSKVFIRKKFRKEKYVLAVELNSYSSEKKRHDNDSRNSK